MSNIFDYMTDELSVTGHPESMEILWDNPEYFVIKDGYASQMILLASINRSTDEIEFNDIGISVFRLDEAQKAEIARRLRKYKDRIIKMHLKHESLHVPVRRLNNGNQV